MTSKLKMTRPFYSIFISLILLIWCFFFICVFEMFFHFLYFLFTEKQRARYSPRFLVKLILQVRVGTRKILRDSSGGGFRNKVTAWFFEQTLVSPAVHSRTDSCSPASLFESIIDVCMHISTHTRNRLYKFSLACRYT